MILNKLIGALLLLCLESDKKETNESHSEVTSKASVVSVSVYAYFLGFTKC